jgi:hypothetical protein
VRPFTIASFLMAVVPRAVAGQELQLGPRAGVGDGSAFTAQVSIRAEALWQSWGFYTSLGVRGVTESCALSCSWGPSTPWELVAGLIGRPRGTPAYLSVGAGAIRRQDGSDLLLEGEFGWRFPISPRWKLGFGVHALVVPEVERANSRVPEAHFVELVVGLSFRVHGP